MQKFLKDVTLFSLANVIVGVVFFCYLFICARLLGREDYGLFQSLMGFHGIVMVAGVALNVAAMHLVGSSAPDRRAAALGACIRAALWAGVAVAAAVALSAPLLAPWIASSNAWPLVCLAGVLIVNILLVTFHGGLQGTNCYGVFAAVRSAESLIVLGAGVGLIMAGAGVAGAIGGYFAGMVVLCVWFVAVGGNYTLRGDSVILRDELTSLQRPLGATALLLLVCNLPVIVARARLPAELSGDVGSLFALRYTVLIFAEATAWPLYTRILAGHRERGMLRNGLCYVLLLGCAFTAVGVNFSELFFRILFGDAYQNASRYMAMYGMYLTLHMLAMVVLFYRAATRRLSLIELVVPLVVLAIAVLWPSPSVESLIVGPCIVWLVYLAVAGVMGTLKES